MVAPDITGRRAHDQAVESWSLGELLDLQRRLLADSGLLSRAGRSSVYQDRWRRANFRPGRISDTAALREAPFTCRQDLAMASRGEGMRQYACSDVALWFRATANQEESIWLPYGKEDIAASLSHWYRASQVTGIGDGDVVLMLTSAAPSLSDSFPYLLAYAHKLRGGARIEIVPVSLALLQRKPQWAEFFLLKKSPTVLVATPDDALALAEMLEKTGETSTPRRASPAAGLQADARSGRRLHNLRFMLLYGDQSSMKIKSVEQEYGVDIFRLHGVLDCPLYYVECRMHQGLHVWLDMCIPEVIPSAELDEERSSPGYLPQAVLLTEAQSGLRGELVMTTFAEALPLVRFRTGEQVEVIRVGPCACGRTHPRLLFL